MIKKINIILITSFVILTILIIWINYLIKNHVGDIEFDSSRDNPSFNICNEKHIYQYYSVGTHYEGERKAMREEIYQQLESKELMLDKKDGIITFRFVVNCNGESDRYRYKSVDANFSKTSFKESEVKKILYAVKNLRSWVSGVNKKGYKVDSYYQINFKIKDGLILDIF
jgi:hypothetical protein